MPHSQPTVSPASPRNSDYTSSSEHEPGPGSEPGRGRRSATGDGIAPSGAEFNAVLISAYDIWNAAASVPDPVDLFRIDSFIELVQGIPPFAAPPSEDLSVRLNDDDLVVECTLEYKTTENTKCAHNRRSSKSYQILGTSWPLSFSPCANTQNGASLYPGLASNRLQDLSCLLLIWSYILSCRWVEILQRAGHKAFLLHQNQYPAVPGWDLIAKCRWEAVLITNEATYYAPWMLTRPDQGALNIGDLVKVCPDISSAWSLLTGFCYSKVLTNECIVALVIVLMLTSGMTAPQLSFPNPTIQSQSTKSTAKSSSPVNRIYDKLFTSLDRFLSLSSIEDGIDSLLCSTFFDPSISCNLVGAHWLGVQKVLQQYRKTPQRLAKAIAMRTPRLSILWLGIFWSEREKVDQIFKNALDPLATTNLLMASWTGTVQSFLQVRYHNMTDRPDLIPRTWEFTTAYFARPDVLKPFTRAPPFGLTKVSNTSLEVREHLNHSHSPVEWQLYWVSKTGKKLTWSGPSRLPSLRAHLLQPADMKPQIPQLEKGEKDRADKISSTATRTLFYWHKNNEEGLWLDDGTQDNIEALRKLQSHPWIRCDFSEDEEVEDVETLPKRGPNVESINDWRIGVQESRRRRPRLEGRK